MKNIIILENISKNYFVNKNEIKVLVNTYANFESGKFYLIVGHSGSGKTTLINIIGLMDLNYIGTYKLFTKDVKTLNDKKLSNYRMKNIGFVFQNFELYNTLTAIENVMLPMTLNKDILKNERKKKAQYLLTELGLCKRLNHFPNELSGGECQRVAIARALANNPSIIIADEPTGNLDKNSEEEVFKILKDLSIKGKCVIVVSHSDSALKYADYIFTLEDGELKRT